MNHPRDKPTGAEPVAGDGNQAARLIDAFLQELDAFRGGVHGRFDVKPFQSVQAILQLPRDQQAAAVIEAVARQTEGTRRFASGGVISTVDCSWEHIRGLKALISALLRKNLPFRIEDVDRLVHLVYGGQGFFSWQLPLGGILRMLEDFCRRGGLPDQLRPRLAALRDVLQAQSEYAETREAVKRLDGLLSPVTAAAPISLLTTDEAWTQYLKGQFDGFGPPARTAWQRLLLHCQTASQSKPSRKWLERAGVLVAEIGPAALSATLSGVLSQVGKPGTPQTMRIHGEAFALDATLIHDTHKDLLRGLIWCASSRAGRQFDRRGG